jgi:hypothetical protein
MKEVDKTEIILKEVGHCVELFKKWGLKPNAVSRNKGKCTVTIHFTDTNITVQQKYDAD